MEILCGIYKITSPSKRFYIGQSRNICKRFKSYHYKSKVKSQVLLHRSFEKYGIENHKFEIILNLNKDISQEKLNFFETMYIKLFKDLNIPLLNIREGGSNGKLSIETKLKISLKNKGKPGPNKGKIFSEETRLKISNTKKERKIPPTKESLIKRINTIKSRPKTEEEIKQFNNFREKGTLKISKKIVQFNMSGEFINNYSSIKEAERITGILHTSIGNCLSKRTKTAGGFKWEYL